MPKTIEHWSPGDVGLHQGNGNWFVYDGCVPLPHWGIDTLVMARDLTMLGRSGRYSVAMTPRDVKALRPVSRKDAITTINAAMEILSEKKPDVDRALFGSERSYYLKRLMNKAHHSTPQEMAELLKHMGPFMRLQTRAFNGYDQSFFKSFEALAWTLAQMAAYADRRDIRTVYNQIAQHRLPDPEQAKIIHDRSQPEKKQRDKNSDARPVSTHLFDVFNVAVYDRHALKYCVSGDPERALSQGAWQILQYLYEHRGQSVSRHELAMNFFPNHADPRKNVSNALVNLVLGLEGAITTEQEARDIIQWDNNSVRFVAPKPA